MDDCQRNDTPLLKSLGIEPNFSDAEGPEVDLDKLRRFVQRQLGPYASEEVRTYIVSFPAWHEAFMEIISKMELSN